jgi:hypothetical protein
MERTSLLGAKGLGKAITKKALNESETKRLIDTAV